VGKKIKLGMDIDSVITEINPVILDKLNTHNGLVLEIEDIVIYNLPKLYGVKRDVFNSILKDIDYVNLPAIVGSIYSLHRLPLEGYEIHLISHRDCRQGLKEETEQWFKNKGVPKYKSLTLTEHKVQRAKELELDMMIEDSPKQAMDFVNNNIPIILFDYPYNRNIESDLIYRVSGWTEAREVINDYSRIKKRQG